MKCLTLPLFFAASVSVFAAPQAYLQTIAEAQKRVSPIPTEAYQKNGANGLKWTLHRSKKSSIDIDISAYKDPEVLLIPKDLGAAMVSGRYYGVKDGKTGRMERFGRGNHAILKLGKAFKSYSQIRINCKPAHYDLWVTEKANAKKIWKKYFDPSFQVYTETWLPLVQSMQSDALFNEAKVFRGRPLPTTPQAFAKVYANAFPKDQKSKAQQLAANVSTWPDAEKIRERYYNASELDRLKTRIERIQPENIRMALADMAQKFPNAQLLKTYQGAPKAIAKRKTKVLQALKAGTADAGAKAEQLLDDVRTLLLANPHLDEVELIAISRKVGNLNLRDHEISLKFPGRKVRRSEGSLLGAPSLSTHSILRNLDIPNPDGWNSSIVKLSNLRGDVQSTALYTSDRQEELISNCRLHWDGDHLAFTMGANDSPMALYELDTKSGKTKQLSPKAKDHFVDSCYLPDGNIVVMSTAVMTALACEGGSHLLTNMYLLNPETQDLRQLGIDQENSYHATVQEDGSVAYVRYEYTDTSHYYTRILMGMNPDGTNQREIYGSNSVWPTSIFYPQQVPGKPNLYSAVVSGHHGPSHMGRLVLFDINRGRREAEGAVQFIGAKDEPVEDVMVDRLYGDDYPKFMYSQPLDAEYYLTMLKPGAHEAWGLYLVDRFDNITLIYEPEEEFIAWPQVYKKKPTPPVIPSRVKPESKESTIYIQDIYEGPGLAGIPRGTVKELAIYAFHYGYKSAASHSYIGIESSWDARYLLGTVPVHVDGSAMFKVPAMLPITLSPLDANGAALQKMRTWMNPQPGEVLSCVGCHETADQAPLPKSTIAVTQGPVEIKDWYGEARPYSFIMEIQPLLDQYCITCHDGVDAEMDLRNSFSEQDMLSSRKYSKSYVALQQYVRRNGPESDYGLITPTEWHASSSKLVQMLKKGHHGVELDDEAFRRLYMWIDLNVPFHAAFHPSDFAEYGDQVQWRANSLKKFANLDWNPEQEYQQRVKAFVQLPAVKAALTKEPAPVSMPTLKAWPMAPAEAKQLQGQHHAKTIEFGAPARKMRSYVQNRAITLTLNEEEQIEFVRIPAGRYIMGSKHGYPNETPRIVEIENAFWMSTTEVSNSQLAAFDPAHDSRYADSPGKDQLARGVPLYHESQPAVRVSHAKAVAFCQWLSQQSGQQIALPTEAQWEWAARAGSADDTWYGDKNSDFSKFANLSDKTRGTHGLFTRKADGQYFNFENSYRDGQVATAPVKSFHPNPWGLYDMIGNAEEWTATRYENTNDYVVKGGSWHDLPEDATSATRWGYAAHIRLPDLGFRIVIND